MNRVVKQILYGLFYLVILAVIIWLVYFLFVRSAPSCFDNKQNQNEEEVDCGGSCISCALKNVQDLTVSSAEIFQAGDKTTILFEIKNPNPTLGIENLPYTINLFDKFGNKAFSVNRNTFIYPDGEKFIVEAGINIDSALISGGELIMDYGIGSWQEDFSQPAIQLVDIKKELEKDKVLISGKIVNDNSFSLLEISVTSALFNKLEFKIAASKVVIDRIEPFSSKEFKIVMPIKPDVILDINLEELFIGVEVKR